MKRTVFILMAASLLACKGGNAQEKTYNEVIKQEIAFQGDNNERTLVIANVFGPITVEGYNGSTVQYEVKKEIFADNAQKLELGKSELQLKASQNGNAVILRPDAPYIKYSEKGLKFNWCNDYEEPEYKHKLSFKVKVPRNVNLKISTVNDGDIEVSNTVSEFLKVNNINGGIVLNQVQGQTDVHCINGNVDISYVTNPNKNSEYYALNGDINVTYQNALSADVSFKSMNGELFTDFDVAKQFTRTKKEVKDSRKGKFKYEATPVVQIGKGGVDFKFETLNGDVFLKKI
ncbi:DUF4097 family beta strand repeat-containing protein [uncultured Croceitalea sp.]|uniref:DUF4097 family beta strand repeat-containing protein n=1 Tax=uncultured Croceitalea sp. TaxID=1798908 RepID=UPI0033063B4C